MTEFQNNPQLINRSQMTHQLLFQKKLNANILNQVAQNFQQNKLSYMQNKQNLTTGLSLTQNKLTNPTINQTTLNLSNQITNTETNLNAQNIVTQFQGEGVRDLPSYAGISNISFKSWINEHDNKGFVNITGGENLLAAIVGELSGFQKKNGRNVELPIHRGKEFSLLSFIFSPFDLSSSQEIETISNVLTFKKLGFLSDKDSQNKYSHEEIKLTPPAPSETQQMILLEDNKIQYLYQLLALPDKFSECLRLFAKNKNYIDPLFISSFLSQRFKLIQKKYFRKDSKVSELISMFVPLLNHTELSQLTPLVLLYYPLPIPYLSPAFNFEVEWERKKENKSKEKEVVATCEIYYQSKIKGRFILKFELLKNRQNNNLNFDIQTSKDNAHIVENIELAISEAMFLLASPPRLFELNFLLDKEICSHLEHGNEMSIISSGPLRLELLLAVYASLMVLSKLC